MKCFTHTLTLAAVGVLLVAATADVHARGGRGGRGGGRVGGGGFSRPSPSFNRSPSMSRSMPSRPTMPSRPSIPSRSPSLNRSPSNFRSPGVSPGLNRSGLNRPTMPSTRPGAGRVSPGGARMPSQGIRSPGSYQAPSANRLGNFLNLPQGAGAGARSTPSNRQSRTVTTPGGSTITFGAGAGSRTTPGGVQVGGAGRGVVVQGPGGNTAARGSGVVGATNGTNSAIAAGSRGAVRGANGGVVAGGRGVRGVTDGVNSAFRAGSAGVARDRYGNAVGAARSVRGVNGSLTARGVAIRRGFTGYGSYYTRGWYARYPGAWFAAGVVASRWWSGAYWGSTYGYCGCDQTPISYDYGDTVTYEGGTVYYDSQPVATTEQYYEQATDIAEAGEQTDNQDWLPLGVFAVVSEGQSNTDKILQLAVNKEGVIRGNFHDKITDQVTPVVGSVDKKTQRVAFRPEKNETLVAECGLFNLTQETLTVLVHLKPGQLEERVLVRLEPPEDGATP